MLYGEKKRLHMRKNALKKNQGCLRKSYYKRQNRQSIRRALRRVCVKDPSILEKVDMRSYAPMDRCFDGPYVYISHSFVRWSTSVTNDIPKESRLGALRGILNNPNHRVIDLLRWYDEFRADNTPCLESVGKEELERIRKKDRDLRRAALRNICNVPSALKMFNSWLKDRHKTLLWVQGYSDHGIEQTERVGSITPRLLRGLGDVDSFLSDISMLDVPCRIGTKGWVRRMRLATKHHWRNPQKSVPTYIIESVMYSRPNPDYHPEWWKAMERFTDTWIECRGDLSQVRERLHTR